MSDDKPRLPDGSHYERGSLVCSRRVLDKLGHMVACLMEAAATSKYITYMERKDGTTQDEIDALVAKRNALLRETEY